MNILNNSYFIAAILLCMGIEFFVSKKNGLSNFSGYEVLSNIVLISLDKIIALATGDGGAALEWLWSYRFFELNFGPATNFILTFVAVEFMYYCNHWYNHHVNIGWATHIMHHSPTKYNFTLGYRLGITRALSLGSVVFIPLVLFGFHPQDIGLWLGIILLYQFFLHTELVPKLGFLDTIINTPSSHRVHHSSNPAHYNKNLGGITLCFDHLFGTFQAEGDRSRMTYGIPAIMEKKNIWYEITCHWRKVFSQFIGADTFRGKVLAIFGSSAQP
ncbi:MAG: sterol desaturase family protein [Bacteriovorax sp.]|jgi:sterol desaturase/sphingolipid hydroxylase (fatty acid hydroxylase superfamily)